jgi:hypothetical protein
MYLIIFKDLFLTNFLLNQTIIKIDTYTYKNN